MRNRRNAKERIAGEIFPNTNARCSTSWFVWQVTASASKKAKASAREWASRTFKRRHVRFFLLFFFFFFLYINEKSNRSLASFSPLLKRRIFSRNEINITKYQRELRDKVIFPIVSILGYSLRITLLHLLSLLRNILSHPTFSSVTRKWYTYE